jgi:hypothetical protein
VSLLRRNVPARELPALCVEEWRKTEQPRDGAGEGRLGRLMEEARRARALPPGRGRAVAAAYNAMCGIVREGRGPRAARPGQDTATAQTEAEENG